MHQEAADELVGFQGHGFVATVVAVVLPAETHLALPHAEKAIVGNSYSMRVASQVGQDLLGSAERPFGVHHPFALA